MKKLFVILMVGGAILATSCGKVCTCTYSEDGKKIYTTKYTAVNKDLQKEIAAAEHQCTEYSKYMAKSILDTMPYSPTTVEVEAVMQCKGKGR